MTCATVNTEMRLPVDSERGENILAFMRKFYRMNGCPPTVREIQEHFGFRSPRAVKYHLERLEKSGKLVRRGFNTSRALLPSDIAADLKKRMEDEAASSPVLAKKRLTALQKIHSLPMPQDRVATVEFYGKIQRLTAEGMASAE